MKTLKKTLCLVLALVMALSLCSVAFAADSNFDGYTDVETIGDAYVEAVDVLMGLGIVNGMSATEIGPEGYYTRAQAAKIVTYMAVGPTVAEMLPTGESFSDVPATHWASKYITYCAEKNILNGITATEYQPEAYVTGYQFAKMILAAAGYGAKGEFVGSGWAVATAQIALPAGLFTGDAKAATNEPITRQQAMLIAFNSLKLEHVVYIDLTNTYNKSLAETAFYGSDITTEGTTAENDLGISGYYWMKGDKQISDVVETDTYVASFSAGDTYGEIAAAAGATKDSKETLQYYANGKAKGELEKIADYVSGDKSKLEIPAGITADLYEDKDGNFKLLTTITYVVEVSAKEVTEKADENYGKYAFTFSDGKFSVTIYDVKDAYKGFYAVVPADDNGTYCEKLLSIEKVEAITAKATKYDATAGTVTVNGTAYAVAAMAEADIYSQVDFTNKLNYYVYDNALYVIDDLDEEEPAAVEIDGYAYVLKFQAKDTVTTGDLFNDAAREVGVKAEIITTAGEKKVVDLAIYTEKDADDKTVYYTYLPDGTKQVINGNWTNESVNAWAAYTVEADEYTAVSMADAAQEYALTAAYAKGTAKLGDWYMNAATTYTEINTADKTVTTATGYKNIAIENGANVLVVFADAKKTTVAAIYEIDTTSDKATTATYAYAADEGATVNGGVEWTFYINGEVKTMTVNLADTSEVSALAEGSVYELSIDTKGVVTAAKLTGAVGDGAKVTVIEETYFATSSVYNYAKTYSVYNVTTGTPGTADSIEVGDYVYVVVGGADAAALIYIVDAPEDVLA